jgi:uncharacterized membrane-anchored protein
MKLKKKTLRFIEFFLIGVIMGITEDVIAIWFATGEKITFHVVWVVFLVALPFAIISEYVVDHPRFWKTIFRIKEENIVAKKDNSR